MAMIEGMGTVATEAISTKRARLRVSPRGGRPERDRQTKESAKREVGQPDETAREVSYLVDHLGRLLGSLASAYREKGRSLTELGLDKLVERMVATVPSVSAWDEQVG